MRPWSQAHGEPLLAVCCFVLLLRSSPRRLQLLLLLLLRVLLLLLLLLLLLVVLLLSSASCCPGTDPVVNGYCQAVVVQQMHVMQLHTIIERVSPAQHRQRACRADVIFEVHLLDMQDVPSSGGKLLQHKATTGKRHRLCLEIASTSPWFKGMEHTTRGACKVRLATAPCGLYSKDARCACPVLQQ